jgi:hypothetical protein
MKPSEIQQHFGRDALNLLYDVIMDRPVHEMADWILLYHTEKEIGEWLVQLKQDELEN